LAASSSSEQGPTERLPALVAEWPKKLAEHFAHAGRPLLLVGGA